MISENRFQSDVRKLLNERIGIHTIQLNNNVPLLSLFPDADPGENLEMDLLAIVGRCAILIETTILARENRDKIKRFIRHCDLFFQNEVPLRERFKLAGDIFEHDLDILESITEWRYLYLGTSQEIITKKLTKNKFQETDRIRIINIENWLYIKALASLIGRFSQFEFLSLIDIGPELLDEIDTGYQELRVPVLTARNKRVAPDTGPADIYLLLLKANDLLKIGRVLRYRGLPIAIESEASIRGYQRILIPDKLKDISRFIGQNRNAAFPSTLTVVLSSDCRLEQKEDGTYEVCIPFKYASIDIIDGQHRLFAYAQDSITDDVRERHTLLVTAIKFRTNDTKKVNEFAAKTFVNINSTHTRVSRSHIDLIKYDILGERTPRAIASKIILECANRPNKILYRIFKTSEFMKSQNNSINPIPTVSIIDQLEKNCDLNKVRENNKTTEMEATYGKTMAELEVPDNLVQSGIAVLEKYFGKVKRVFNQDWNNVDSNLMCSKYLGGFICLLKSFTDQGLSFEQMEAKLTSIKGNLLNQYYPGGCNQDTAVVFLASNALVPTKRDTSPSKIHQLLLDMMN